MVVRKTLVNRLRAILLERGYTFRQGRKILGEHARTEEATSRLTSIPGIGILGATALMAAVGDGETNVVKAFVNPNVVGGPVWTPITRKNIRIISCAHCSGAPRSGGRKKLTPWCSARWEHYDEAMSMTVGNILP